MKQKKGTWLLLCAVIIMFTLCLQLPINASDGSDITVQLEELADTASQRQGVILELYQVGDVSDYGEARLQACYGIAAYPQTAKQTEEAASYIANHLQSKAVQVQKTSAEGTAVFSQVDNGVYLLVARTPNAYGVMDPVLFHVPYYEEIDGVRNGPLFQLTVKPKASANKKQITDKQTDKENTNHKDLSKVNTGDDSNMVGYMLLAGLATGLMLCLFIRNRKGGTK